MFCLLIFRGPDQGKARRSQCHWKSGYPSVRRRRCLPRLRVTHVHMETETETGTGTGTETETEPLKPIHSTYVGCRTTTTTTTISAFGAMYICMYIPYTHIHVHTVHTQRHTHYDATRVCVCLYGNSSTTNTFRTNRS